MTRPAPRSRYVRLLHRLLSMIPSNSGVFQVVFFPAVFAGLGALLVFSRRRTLRPWLLWLPVTLALVIVPIAVPLIQDVRSHAGGESAAWGRLGEVIILLWLIPVFCAAGGALLALMVLLPRYGYADRAAVRAQRKGPWYGILLGRRTAEELRLRSLVSLWGLVVIGLLWLLGVRPG